MGNNILTADTLRDNEDIILLEWIKGVIENIPVAKTKEPEVVQDHIHLFLKNLHESVRSGENFWKEQKNLQLGSMHGRQRLSLKDYSLNDVIYEYNILRRTIFNILDSKIEIDKNSRDMINEMIDEAIRRACVEFEKNSKIDEEQLIWQNAIISSAIDHIWIMDKELKLTYVNPALLKSWNLKEEDVVGQSLKSLNYPKDLEAKISSESSKILLGHTLRSELTYPDSLGKEKTYDYIMFPVRNNYNDILAIAGISRDITDLKNLENTLSKAKEDLQNAVNVRDKFISIASHELKTPLTSLKLLVQIESRKISKLEYEIKPDEIKKFIRRVEEYIKRFSRLINDMLDLSRINRNKMIYNFSKNDICDFITEITSHMHEYFEQEGTELNVGKCEHVMASFDKERLEQVIVNLLTNSLKYGQGKPVSISAEAFEDKLVIKIIDHGMGIKKEDQEKIFNPFERLVSANEVSGFGIGLSISKEIVEGHHGRIIVQSELNKGSEFSIELPLLQDNANSLSQ